METDRLLLRPWRTDDLDALAPLFAEPAVWRFPFGRGLTREESERFIERQMGRWAADGFCMWAAVAKEERRLIGFVGLAVPVWLPKVLPAVEIGWRLHPDHWGRGLATEGGRACLGHGFDVLGLERIISIFEPDNTASGRVMTKLGMRDCLTTADPGHGRPLLVREITAEQWRATAGDGDGPQ